MVSHVAPVRVSGSSFSTDRVRAWTARSRSGRSSSTVACKIACAVSKYRWARWSRNAGDLPLWDRRLRGQQVIGQCFDSLTDLQQSDADRVEDQRVGQIAALQVGTDRVDRAWISARRWRSR